MPFSSQTVPPPYSLPYLDLMTHTVKEKESTMLRLLAGSTFSRQIIHSLLTRGARLIADTQSFQHTPQPCPKLPHHLESADPRHYCWALSLIQYLQASSSNIHTTTPFPTTTSTCIVTQTPLHSLHDLTTDHPLTLNDIKEFETSYHIYFLEERFPYPLRPYNEYLPHLLSLFPQHIHRFIVRLIHDNHSNPNITPGIVIMREHLLLKLPHNTSPTYIEGILPLTPPSPSPQALTRQWIFPPRSTIRGPPSLILPHQCFSNIRILNIPRSPFTCARYIRSGIGYTPKHSVCNYTTFTQYFLPRHSPPPSHTYAQPTFACNLHPNILAQWHHLTTHPNHTLNIYTDGSLKHTAPLQYIPTNLLTLLPKFRQLLSFQPHCRMLPLGINEKQLPLKLKLIFPSPPQQPTTPPKSLELQ